MGRRTTRGCGGYEGGLERGIQCVYSLGSRAFFVEEPVQLGARDGHDRERTMLPQHCYLIFSINRWGRPDTLATPASKKVHED